MSAPQSDIIKAPKTEDDIPELFLPIPTYDQLPKITGVVEETKVKPLSRRTMSDFWLHPK